MDRIPDSGSDDMSSILIGCTKKRGFVIRSTNPLFSYSALSIELLVNNYFLAIVQPEGISLAPRSSARSVGQVNVPVAATPLSQ